MKKYYLSFPLVLFLFVFTTYFCIGQQSTTALVNLRADEMHPIKIGDSSVLVMVKDVAFHHNGAIIVCDSAIRYSATMLEFYGNVIINKDSTYIYGDMADFNGDIATVYSPLVKTIDKDVTIYSYDLEYNTLTSVGRYTKGGTITQQDNLMESIEGAYYSEERIVLFSDDVVMKNDEYLLMTDSMGYNFDTEITTFYKKAHIWNKDGNYLTADRGSYNRITDTYTFTDNSYIMTDDYQTWADSIIFNQTTEVSHLFNDIQIIDEEQKVLLFGDYGIYWRIEENAMITRDPSMVSYDTSEGRDSTFMRSDSIFIYTLPIVPDDYSPGIPEIILDEMDFMEKIMLEGNLDDFFSEDFIDIEFNPVETEDISDVSDEIISEKKNDDNEYIDSRYIPENGPIQTDNVSEYSTPSTDRSPVKTQKQIRQEKKEARRMARREKKKTVSENVIIEEVKDVRVPFEDLIDSVNFTDSMHMDDIIHIENEITDSLERIIRAYRDVRIYRSDLQAVCDSLVGFSRDSTLHMYIEPVLWNEDSQITSDIMHFYSRNEELYKAEFEGQPLMVQYVVDSMYNQLASRIMNAYFVDNSIRMLEAIGNAQSYYYYQEEEDSDEVNGFSTMECSYINFYFANEKLEEIRWHDDVDYALYPMDKIPETQSQFMRNFKWEDERRPKSRFDVFNRRIRESVRDEILAIPQPVFRITEEIHTYRNSIIDEGIWVDRDEDIWVIYPDDFFYQSLPLPQ